METLSDSRQRPEVSSEGMKLSRKLSESVQYSVWRYDFQPYLKQRPFSGFRRYLSIKQDSELLLHPETLGSRILPLGSTVIRVRDRYEAHLENTTTSSLPTPCGHPTRSGASSLGPSRSSRTDYKSYNIGLTLGLRRVDTVQTRDVRQTGQRRTDVTLRRLLETYHTSLDKRSGSDVSTTQDLALIHVVDPKLLYLSDTQVCHPISEMRNRRTRLPCSTNKESVPVADTTSPRPHFFCRS